MIIAQFLSRKKKEEISVKKWFRFSGLRVVDRRKNLKRKDFFTRIRFQRGYGRLRGRGESH
jgi:hypothetical protein